MKVRNRTLENSEYKGRMTDASKSICPCMPCFDSHDCGRYVYTGVNQKEWKVDMQCATRHNNGCPRPLDEPKHIYTSKYGKICQRCGFVRAKKRR